MSAPLFSRWSLGGVLLGLTLSAGMIISSAQVTRAWLHISDSHVITATGSAYEEVTSDKAVWNAIFSAEADSLADAQKKLKEDAARVQEFFAERGMTNAELSAINLSRLTRANKYGAEVGGDQRTAAFRLSRTVRLESSDVQRVMDLQQQSIALVEQGVELDDQGIQFMYTKVAEAKINMLGAAAKDARQRAEQIASQGGRQIRSMRDAHMGVFQITPRDSNQTSGEGINDISSRDKTIRAVVSASFSLE